MISLMHSEIVRYAESKGLLKRTSPLWSFPRPNLGRQGRVADASGTTLFEGEESDPAEAGGSDIGEWKLRHM